MNYEWDKEKAMRKAQEYVIPGYMLGPLLAWVTHGKRPGPFLSAVIANNLRVAVYEADDENLHLLHSYVQWFYNWAPAKCWGSLEALELWKGTEAIHGQSND